VINGAVIAGRACATFKPVDGRSLRDTEVRAKNSTICGHPSDGAVAINLWRDGGSARREDGRRTISLLVSPLGFGFFQSEP